MAVCLVMQFTGVDAAKYEAVMEKLGLQSANANWPKGIISHVAGFDSDGMYVVDVWEGNVPIDVEIGGQALPTLSR